MSPRFVDERWRTIRSALESWPRTVRLCLIILAAGSPVYAMLWTIIR